MSDSVLLRVRQGAVAGAQVLALRGRGLLLRAGAAAERGALRPAAAVDLHGRGDLSVRAAMDLRIRLLLAHCQRAQSLLRAQALSEVLGICQQVSGGLQILISDPFPI